MKVGNQDGVPLNPNQLFIQDMVDGRMAYVPNDIYKRQEIEKVDRHILFMLRVYFFKYMLENIQESKLAPLTDTQNKTNNSFNNWKKQIDEHIRAQKQFLATNEQELQRWNGVMKEAITRKEHQGKAVQKLQADADPLELENQYEQLKRLILEITQTTTRLNVSKAKGQEILDGLTEFKIKLETEFTQIRQQYLNDFEFIDQSNKKLNNQLYQIFLASRELMQNQNYGLQTGILHTCLSDLNNFLNNVNILFLKYLKFYQDLDYQSKQVGIRKEQMENTIYYEVGKCNLKFLEAEIQYRETKKRKLLIVLHGLMARDAVTTLRNTNAQADANFQTVRANQPIQRQNGGPVTNYEYELIDLNPQNVTYQADTLHIQELIKRYNREIYIRQAELNRINTFEVRLKELTQRLASLRKQNQMSYEQMLNSGEVARTKQFQYYQITLMEFNSYHIERQSIQALLGCISKNIAFKKVGCCSCYSCFPSCYTKTLHTYNDLYYEDYERIFIKTYRYHHQVQSTISIDEIKEFKLANISEFLLDFDIIGAYRNDQGFRQEVQSNYRSNEFNRALHFTIANIANLFALQEIIKLQINEQKHRTIIMREFTSVLSTIKAGDLSIPQIDYPQI